MTPTDSRPSSQKLARGRRLHLFNFACTFWLGLLLFGCAEHLDSSLKDQAELAQDEAYLAFNQACDSANYPEALRQAEILTHRFSRNGSAWNSLGYAWEQSHQLGEAIKAYKRAVEVNPDHAKAWFNLGIVKGKIGQLSEEIRCYQQAIQLRPKHAKTWLNLSVAYAQSGKANEADAAYKEALRIDPSIVFLKDAPSHTQTSETDSISSAKKQEVIPLGTLDDPALSSQTFDQEAKAWSSSEPLWLRWNSSVSSNSFFSIPIDFLNQIGSSHTSTNWFSDQKVTAQLWNNRGFFHEKRREWDSAIRSYTQALQVLWGDPMVWNNLGMAHSGLEQYTEAIICFEQALQFADSAPVRENLAWAHYGLAKKLVREKKLSQATSHLRAGLQLKSDLVQARFSLFSILLQKNAWKEALTEAELLVQHLPHSAIAWYALGVARAHLHRDREAVEALSQAVRLKSNIREIWHILGIEQLRLKQYDRAILSFARCSELEPSHALSWYLLGASYYQQNQWGEAIPCLKQYIQKSAETVQARKLLASAYERLGNYSEATAEYSRILKDDPSEISVWKSLAQSHASSLQWEESAKAWRQASDLDPKDGEAWASLGNALWELGRRKESRDAYHKAILMGYVQAEVWNNLGVAHAHLGEYSEALSAFGEAARLRKNDPDILLNIGYAFHHLKRPTELDRTLKLLRRLNPQKAAELTDWIHRDE